MDNFAIKKLKSLVLMISIKIPSKMQVITPSEIHTHNHECYQCRRERIENDKEDGRVMICCWCCVLPPILLGIFAFTNIDMGSPKSKNDCFIAFWVFISIDIAIVGLCLLYFITISSLNIYNRFCKKNVPPTTRPHPDDVVNPIQSV